MNIYTKHHGSKAITRLILETAIKNKVDNALTRRPIEDWVTYFTTYEKGKIAFYPDAGSLFYGDETTYNSPDFKEVSLDEFLATLEKPREIKVRGDWVVTTQCVKYVYKDDFNFSHDLILELAEAIKKIKNI